MTKLRVPFVMTILFGLIVGISVATLVVIITEGSNDDAAVGAAVSLVLGVTDGEIVGATEGMSVGSAVGSSVG